MQGLELGRLEGEVHIAPPDGVLRFGVLHAELVLGTASGEFARFDGECSAVREHTLTVHDGMLDQFSGFEVPISIAYMAQTDL